MIKNYIYSTRSCYIKKSIPVWLIAMFLVFVCFSGCSKKDPEAQFASLMQKAAKFKEEKKFDEARISLQSAIDIKPGNPTPYYELAEILVRLKKFQKAIQSYQTVINIDPSHNDARLRLAAMMIAAGELELAESHVKTLVEKVPDNEDVLLLQSTLYASRRQYDDARSTLEKVVQKNPNNAAAFASLADIERRSGHGEKAEELFLKALALSPDNQPIQVALADLYSQQGRLDDAQNLLQQIVTANPDNTTLKYFFGEFLVQRGLVDQAQEQYEQSVSNDASQHFARDRLYDIYLNRMEMEKAKGLTDALAKKDPKSPALDYFQGRNLEIDKKFSEALDRYLLALQNLPGFSPAFRRAGLVEFMLGKRQEGLEHLNQAITIDPNDIGARLAIGRHLFFKREYTLANEHAEKILRQYPLQIGANILKADIALMQGDVTSAERIFSAILQTLPNSTMAHIKMGLLEEKKQNREAAIEHYRRAAAIDKGAFVAIRRIAELLAGLKGVDAAISELEKMRSASKLSIADYDIVLGSLFTTKVSSDANAINKAREYFEDALKIQPNHMAAYFGLARLDAVEGKHDRAINNYEQILKQNPKHIPTHMLLALTFERLGQFEDSASQYRKILEISPRFAPAANNLAWLISDVLSSDLNEAQRFAEIAKEEQPNDSAISDTLGWIHYKQGSLQTALSLLEEAVDTERNRGVPNPEILYHLGVVTHATGDSKKAAELLKESLKIGGAAFPKAKEINELLAKM